MSPISTKSTGTGDHGTAARATARGSDGNGKVPAPLACRARRAGEGRAGRGSAFGARGMGAAGRSSRPGRVAWRSRRRRGCRSWCRSGMGGCWCRRSRSIGARRSDGGRSRRRRRGPACTRSCAVMRICRTSVRSRPRTGGWCSSVNDFDETLPGPFEWDVKRLVASFAVAGRDRRVRPTSSGERSTWRSARRTGRR